MEKKIGKDIKEYQCQILELDERITFSVHRNRPTYHFNATVEVNGNRMTLTCGNAKLYMLKYDQGDMITVYEYKDEYSFVRSDLLVTGPFRIIGIFGGAFSIACLMMVLVSKMAGPSKRSPSTLTLGNLNANLNGGIPEDMDAYKAQLIQKSDAIRKKQGQIAGCFLLVVLIVVAIIVIVALNG